MSVSLRDLEARSAMATGALRYKYVGLDPAALDERVFIVVVVALEFVTVSTATRPWASRVMRPL